MNSKRKFIKISLLVITIVLFVTYYLNNQDSFSRLSSLTPTQVLLIVFGQSLVLLGNIIALSVIVSFFKKKITFTDSLRITLYSSLINFFGFFQGGVGFRGIYLYKYFSIPFKKYVLVTSVQYFLLFSMAGLMIFIGINLTHNFKHAILLVTVLVLVSGLVALVANRFRNNTLSKLLKGYRSIKFIFQCKKIFLLAGTTLLITIGSLITYWTALNVIGANITLGGLLIFTGVSFFSIVIAITPGALGIREGMLLLAQGQMLITTNDIILASTIDRSVYFITLMLLVPSALSFRNKISQEINT